MDNGRQQPTIITFHKIEKPGGIPGWTSLGDVAQFFHETMQPYEDSLEDINAALDYMFSQEQYAGGFLMLAEAEGRLAGALLMLNTGMGGYVPENLLLFVSVDPALRGQGVGGRLIERSFNECEGDVKLHVDFDNPAKRLYERMGMKHVYAEMRLKRP
jgi:ribosomal-protein-alanine N-acetyltransferase